MEDQRTDEGALTDQFLRLVGERIRDLRLSQDLTVQHLATRAGISRRLLTQIEHGQANPSLVAITRIARQLGTESTELLAAGSEPGPISTTPEHEHVLVWTSAQGSTAHLLAATHSRTADLWRWELLPGDSYHGSPDPTRSQELFYVLTGYLTLEADETSCAVPAGASARLDSDRRYAYRNDDDKPCVFLRTVALRS